MFIKNIKENEIIVVGTNLAGEHLGGAAKQAYNNFGLEWSVGEGLSGKTYAFPTLTERLFKRSLGDLMDSRDFLYQCCEENKNKVFLLTPVGIGIAGYPIEQIKVLFTNPPKNLILPEDFN